MINRYRSSCLLIKIFFVSTLENVWRTVWKVHTDVEVLRVDIYIENLD